jgi:chorismate-pyruvate lyase
MKKAAPAILPGESCDRFLDLLGEFYDSMAERPAIDVAFIPPDALPQPQRSLLVHFEDMTSTLTRHHGEPITLRVLDRHEGPQWYRRHIVLETVASRRPIEYGAMRILLPLLSEAARQDVLAARTPLGAILARHNIAFRHCPGGFFRIQSNALIEQALGLSRPQRLYGRCNCMSDSVGRVVAEVIEILPP